MNVAVIPNFSTGQPMPAGISSPDRRRYDALLDILERRVTARQFDPNQSVSEEACRLILEAARHSPSGANAQPWHFIAVDSAAERQAIAAALVAAHSSGAPDAMGAARPAANDYRGAATAPGCLVVATDFRLTWAYPGLMDGTELDQRYHATAERIILQSVAAATMAAHLAATALGYQTWWISVLGQDDLQAQLRVLVGVPDDLTITDIMLFGVASPPPPRRWKKRLDEVLSWNRFDMGNFRSLDQIDAWMKDVRQKLRRLK
jgi:nitroreductase